MKKAHELGWNSTLRCYNIKKPLCGHVKADITISDGGLITCGRCLRSKKAIFNKLVKEIARS